MILTISGKPGSGKSVIAKEVAKRLNLKYYCVGDFQRQIAKKKGISLIELGELEEKDSSIDIEIDKIQAELGKKQENMIVDSRIGFHFIPKSIKIFLDVDLEIGAGRIFKQRRDDERFSTLKKTMEEIKKRAESEKKRYMKYYGVSHYDMENYDIVIDTTGRTIEGVVDEIMKKVSAKNGNGNSRKNGKSNNHNNTATFKKAGQKRQ